MTFNISIILTKPIYTLIIGSFIQKLLSKYILLKNYCQDSMKWFFNDQKFKTNKTFSVGYKQLQLVINRYIFVIRYLHFITFFYVKGELC